jgi:tetratricopeptide (TPR) repeat protein
MKPLAIRLVFRAHTLWIVVSLAVFASFPPPAAPAEPSPPHQLECEYGITLALSGKTAAAESVFISLLSHSPGDARALNNLGNLALFDGDAAAALAFYRQAAVADTADPGIVLNEATTLMLLGKEDAAVKTAAKGVDRAGGFDLAAGYLGLFYTGDASQLPRGEKKSIRREEALMLLRAAAGKVPADSTKAGAPTKKEKKPAPYWRLASPRAGDDGDLPAVVYWKR